MTTELSEARAAAQYFADKIGISMSVIKRNGMYDYVNYVEHDEKTDAFIEKIVPKQR